MLLNLSPLWRSKVISSGSLNADVRDGATQDTDRNGAILSEEGDAAHSVWTPSDLRNTSLYLINDDANHEMLPFVLYGC